MARPGTDGLVVSWRTSFPSLSTPFMGRISFLKYPPTVALCAFWWLAMAKSWHASRVISHLSAIIWAAAIWSARPYLSVYHFPKGFPMGLPCTGSRSGRRTLCTSS